MTHVLITDYDFLDHSIEEAILDAAGIAFTAAQIRSEDDLIAAARGSDALLLQYKADQITPEQYHTARAKILGEQ